MSPPSANGSAGPNGAAQKSFSAEEITRIERDYAEDGYVVLRGVVPKHGLARLHTRMVEEFDRMKRSGGLFDGGGAMSGHLNSSPGEEARFVYQALEESGVIAIVRRLIPSATRSPNVGCNFNLPNSVVQHYHPDSAFKQSFAIVNVAVVDTNLVNGAIDVLPGTHKKWYPFWRYAVERAYERTTRLPMEAGDVLIRVSTLWHRGMPNNSGAVRPMVAFTWEDGGSPLEDPFREYDGKIVFRPNWFRPTRLGRIRERTFVKAPITYSAYRFVRSLIGQKGYETF